MATPIYEYNADDDALQCMRGSVAVKEDYVNGFSDLAAFEKNTKPIALASIIEPEFTNFATAISLTLDTYNDRVLGFRSDSIITAVTDVTTTADLVNVATHADTTTFWDSLTDPSIVSIVSASAGVQYVSIGDVNTDIPGAGDQGKLYKTTDNFVSFTEVFGTEYGAPFRVEASGDNVLFGLYHLPGLQKKTQSVYLSPSGDLGTFDLIYQRDALADGSLSFTVAMSTPPVEGDILTQAVSGATMTVWKSTTKLITGLVTGVWDTVNTFTSNDTGATMDPSPNTPDAVLPVNSHMHKAVFAGDNDTIAIQAGDGDFSFFGILTRPVGAGVWDSTLYYEASMQLSSITYHAGYIYGSIEGITFAKSLDMIRFNVSTQEFDFLGHISAIGTINAAPYNFNEGTDGALSNTIMFAGGLYWTNQQTFSGGLTTVVGGLYASNDAKNWSRVLSSNGSKAPLGILSGQLVFDSYDAAGTSRLTFMDIPTIKVINATRAEKSATNVIDVYNPGGTDNWDIIQFDGTLSELTANRLYSTESGYTLEVTDESEGTPALVGSLKFRTGLGTTDTGAEPTKVQVPTAGDYMMLTMDVRFTGWKDWDGLTNNSVKYFAVETGGSGSTYKSDYRPFSEDWQRVYIMAKAGTPNVAARAIQNYISYYGDPVLKTGLKVDVQNVQMYYDAERADLRSYTSKNTTKADDYSLAPLTGLGSSWSVTFDWSPLNPDVAFPTGAVTTLPITTIKGSNGSYLELYWDRAAYDGAGGGQAFKLTDGATTISLDAELSQGARWQEHDLLKFAITSDGTNTILYYYAPENKIEQGGAILSATDATTNIDIPTSIILGADDAETLIGAGAFVNIRGFDSVLSAGDVADVFNSVNDLIIPAATGGYRSRYSGGGR